ncbi:MAG: hypothetical protein IH849_10640 [Acidobacteria bacterium]|nr:hypothetical protein [Acidobacteriota bacterium]
MNTGANAASAEQFEGLVMAEGSEPVEEADLALQLLELTLRSRLIL